jgi:hypothetical protein
MGEVLTAVVWVCKGVEDSVEMKDEESNGAGAEVSLRCPAVSQEARGEEVSRPVIVLGLKFFGKDLWCSIKET